VTSLQIPARVALMCLRSIPMALLAWMRANPFDLRTLLFAKHAQHVVLIHFPIALFIAP
jgi:hypothetical protein